MALLWHDLFYDHSLVRSITLAVLLERMFLIIIQQSLEMHGLVKCAAKQYPVKIRYFTSPMSGVCWFA